MRLPYTSRHLRACTSNRGQHVDKEDAAVKSLAASISIVITLMGVAAAQTQTEFPTRTVTLVVTQAPGGGMDTTARLLARKMTDALGQSVIVENRPGGAENV